MSNCGSWLFSAESLFLCDSASFISRVTKLNFQKLLHVNPQFLLTSVSTASVFIIELADRYPIGTDQWRILPSAQLSYFSSQFSCVLFFFYAQHMRIALKNNGNPFNYYVSSPCYYHQPMPDSFVDAKLFISNLELWWEWIPIQNKS